MDLRDFQNRQLGPEDFFALAKKYLPQIAVFLVVTILLMAGMSMLYRIDASDEGVVLRFGRDSGTTVPSGLHWKLPWPIETVYKVPMRRIQSLEFGFATQEAGRVTRYEPDRPETLAVSEMLTADLSLANVQWVVQYRVKNAHDFLFSIGGTEPISSESLPSGKKSDVNPAVPDTIRDVAESVVRTLVGDKSIDSVLMLDREKIASDAHRQIQAMLNEFKAGVEIVTVKLKSTSPPEQVKDAFQEVNRARQKKEQVVNEAEGERNRQIPAARGKKKQAISEANGYRERVILETEGRISAFEAQLAKYQLAKEVTQIRLYLDAVETALASVGQKTIIDASIRGMVPLLDLDRDMPARSSSARNIRAAAALKGTRP